MSKCPLCNGDAKYVGLNKAECYTKDCVNGPASWSDDSKKGKGDKFEVGVEPGVKVEPGFTYFMNGEPVGTVVSVDEGNDSVEVSLYSKWMMNHIALNADHGYMTVSMSKEGEEFRPQEIIEPVHRKILVPSDRFDILKDFDYEKFRKHIECLSASINSGLNAQLANLQRAVYAAAINFRRFGETIGSQIQEGAILIPEGESGQVFSFVDSQWQPVGHVAGASIYSDFEHEEHLSLVGLRKDMLLHHPKVTLDLTISGSEKLSKSHFLAYSNTFQERRVEKENPKGQEDGNLGEDEL